MSEAAVTSKRMSLRTRRNVCTALQTLFLASLTPYVGLSFFLDGPPLRKGMVLIEVSLLFALHLWSIKLNKESLDG